jgi:plastocyanin
MKATFIPGAAALVLCATSFTTPAQDAPAPSAATGSIRGVVSYEGTRPEPLPATTIDAKASEGCCEGTPDCVDATDRTLLVSEKGGICNVVVTLTVKGQTPVVPKDPIVLDQRKCNFEPHILVVPVGATLEYKNSDGVNHNIHTYSRKNKAVNNNIAGGGSSTQVLDKDEDFDVKCDIHPWMLARVPTPRTGRSPVSTAASRSTASRPGPTRSSTGTSASARARASR